jgi:hypothetical protein
MSNEIQEHDDIYGRIGEMGTADAIAIDLPVNEAFLNRVRAEDENPMFVTAEVESGWSRSKRHWKPEHLRKVVDLVNSKNMGGVLGHPLLNKEDHDSAFPKPQVLWVAAKLTENGGKAVARFKGYVLKSAEAREYLKLGLIDGVSIFGDTRMKPVQGGYEVIAFDPESIDFARMGRAGMKSRVVALAGEQASEGGKVEPKDIAALQPEEIKTHAPLVFKAIQDEGRAEVETKVGEQATAIAELQPQVDLLAEIRKLLKLEDGDNPLEKVTNLIERIEGASASEIKDHLKALIAKKIKTERGQALVGRLIGEMHTNYEGPLTDDLKKKIEEDFNALTESDEEIKTLVGEMASFRDDDSRGGEGGAGLGGRSRAGSSRGRSENEDGIVRKTENITVRKRTLV